MGLWISIEPITKLGRGNRKLKENEKLQTTRILREIKKEIRRQTGLSATWNESKNIMIEEPVFDLGHEVTVGFFLDWVSRIEGYKGFTELAKADHFSHLMLPYGGYHIPWDFAKPFRVEVRYGPIPIGSSVRLKRELEEIRGKSPIDLDLGICYSLPLERDEDIIAYVWWTLYVASLLSCKSATPMYIA